MLNSNQINVLGNILETSWGKSSNDFHCTAKWQGNLVRVMYSTIVYLASERSMNSQIPPVALESIERIKARTNSAKKAYKEQTGESLAMKEISSDESVEYIQASSLSPRKVVLYRRVADFEVS
ncbi:MAG TPA: hypothetical protein EYG21_03160 [Nitrospinaceae bacterium]|jgi:hypothetical protein|nr:hypothetical protein [Nitrospinaceae bacterium]